MTVPADKAVPAVLILICTTFLLLSAAGAGFQIPGACGLVIVTELTEARLLTKPDVATPPPAGAYLGGLFCCIPLGGRIALPCRIGDWLSGSGAGCTGAWENGLRATVARLQEILCGDGNTAFTIGLEEPASDPSLPLSVDPAPIIALINQKGIFGAEPNPTGNPIGGGGGYSGTITPTDLRVRQPIRTTEEFLDALEDARAGDVVYIDEMTSIDLTAVQGGVTVPAGVTIAGNRGARTSAASAVYRFETGEPGVYFLWGSISTGRDDASLWISVDGSELHQRDLGHGEGWHWVRLGSSRLSAGDHVLTVQWQEDGLALDSILIADDPACDPARSQNELGEGDCLRIEAETGVRSSPLDAAPDPEDPDRIALSVPDGYRMRDAPFSAGGAIVLGAAPSRSPTMLIAGGEDVRITGLVIEGPDKTTGDVDQSVSGISSAYPGLEVDNCEILGWSGAAITFYGTGSGMKTGGYVHHNSIHHCQAIGLGYGVVVAQGSACLVEANLFDYCRHAIAGTGDAGNSYEVRYNIFGSHFPQSNAAHVVDMHGYSSSSGNVAGDRLIIHHNTFEAISTTDYSIAVRGIPKTGAYIENNWIQYTGAPIGRTGVTSSQVNTRMYIGNNKGPTGSILPTLQQRIISNNLS